MSRDAALWAAIYDLYELLIERINVEDRYQVYFEQHPIALEILGFDKSMSFEKRSGNQLPFDEEKGFRPEPDFIGVNTTTGLVAVIELKTPFVGSITTSRADGNRLKFKADAESYISQASEYADSIKGREESRRIISSKFGIDTTSAYKAILIYAHQSENDLAKITRLCSTRSLPTEVITYDTLLDRLISQYSISRKDTERRDGWCITFHIYLPTKQTCSRAYIADLGKGPRDRLSVVLTDETLWVECIDSTGHLHSLSSRIELRTPTYVRFEFSNDGSGIYMSLNVNNIEHDLRVGTRVLDFSPERHAFVLGADSFGDNGAAFFFMELYLFYSTTTLIEKLGAFHYFSRNLSKWNEGVEYRPESYLTRTPDGAFIQEQAHLRPVFRKMDINNS